MFLNSIRYPTERLIHGVIILNNYVFMHIRKLDVSSFNDIYCLDIGRNRHDILKRWLT